MCEYQFRLYLFFYSVFEIFFKKAFCSRLIYKVIFYKKKTTWLLEFILKIHLGSFTAGGQLDLALFWFSWNQRIISCANDTINTWVQIFRIELGSFANRYRCREYFTSSFICLLLRSGYSALQVIRAEFPLLTNWSHTVGSRQSQEGVRDRSKKRGCESMCLTEAVFTERYGKHSRTPLTLILSQADKIANKSCSCAPMSVCLGLCQTVYSEFILRALCPEMCLS